MLGNFSAYSMIYANVDGIRDLLKQDLALEFCRKQNKYIIILTETHIKHDQILVVTYSSHTKRLIDQLHAGLEGVTEIDTNPKGTFASFKITLSNNLVLSVFVSIQGITPERSWLEGVCLKDYKITWKINVRKMKTNLYLETLIFLWIKWTGMVEVKYKDFINVASKA